MHTVRAALRSTKDFVNNYSQAEANVREATSNDPWGAPAGLLHDIAEATHNTVECKEIMEMTFKRMNDSGKNWRHVSKSLNLLDYLIKNGADRVVEFARRRLHDVRTLKEFQFTDEDGKDQGVNIRVKSKELTQLIQDDDLIAQEREKARQVRIRLSGKSSHQTSGSNSDYRDRSYNSSTSRSNNGNGGGANEDYNSPYRDDFSYSASEQRRAAAGQSNSTTEDDDREYARALEESKRQFAIEQDLRLSQQQASSEHLSRALERSKLEDTPTPRSAEPAVDLFSTGSSAAFGGNSNTAFSSSGSGAGGFAPPPQASHRQRTRQSVANPPAQQQQQLDPFGSDDAPDYEFVPKKVSSQTKETSFDPFASATPTAQSYGGSSTAGYDPFAAPKDPFGGSTTKPTGTGFDAAFDGGKEAKKLPHQLAGKNDANAMLAAIARNATQIDEFAQLGDSRLRASATTSTTSHATTPSMSIPAAAPVNLAPPSSNSAFGGASSFDPFSTPTPANSFNPGPNFNAPTPANSFNPPNAFATYGQQTQSFHAPIQQNTGAYNPYASGQFGAPAASTSASVPFDPFASIGAQPLQPSPFGAAATSNDPFGNIVDLSADSFNASRNSKNPFGSTARKYDWGDQGSKPQASLNDIKKQQQPGTSLF